MNRTSILMTITLLAISLYLATVKAQASTAASAPQSTGGWQIVVVPNPAAEIKAEYKEAFKRVRGILSSSLQNAGYNVFSASQLGLTDCLNEPCPTLTEYQLLQQARKTNSQTNGKINLLLIYDVVISKKTAGWHIRVPAYTLELDSGKQADHWTGSQRDFSDRTVNRSFGDSARRCLGSCFANWLAQSAASITRDAGHGVIVQLNERTRQIDYQLIVSDFALGEMPQIEQLLRQNISELTFSLDRDHRSQLLHQLANKHYRYRSAHLAGVLTGQLQQLLTTAEVAGKVSYQRDNRVFTISREGMPYLVDYIVVLFLLSSLVYALLAGWRFKLNQMRITRLIDAGQIEHGIDYVNRMMTLGWPKKRGWLEQLCHWQNALKAIQQGCDNAQTLAGNGQYSLACAELQAVVNCHGDSEAANQLLAKLQDWQKGLVLFNQASRALVDDPTGAVAHLTEAKALNPMLTAKITDLQADADKAVEQRYWINRVQAADEQARQLMVTGQSNQAYQAYQVLLLLDQTMAELGDISSDMADGGQKAPLQVKLQVKLKAKLKAKLKVKLRATRQTVIGQMAALEGCVLGSGALENVYFYSGQNLVIGRNVGLGDGASMVLPYKRLSRGGKQNLLSRRGNQLVVMDTGSSNGSWLNGQALIPGIAQKLNDGAVLSMGGQRLPEQLGLCQLKMTIPAKSPQAVIIKTQQSLTPWQDRNTLQAGWSTMDSDSQKTWVLPGEGITIGIDGMGRLDLGCVKGSGAVAVLRFAGGLKIAPCEGHCSAVKVAGVDIIDEVPLVAGVEISLNSLVMAFL
ncbi:MAG: hypothetical protein ACI8WB_002476 [Phenylobacterium sp.]|jgi:hypothetical protein